MLGERDGLLLNLVRGGGLRKSSARRLHNLKGEDHCMSMGGAESEAGQSGRAAPVPSRLRPARCVGTED